MYMHTSEAPFITLLRMLQSTQTRTRTYAVENKVEIKMTRTKIQCFNTVVGFQISILRLRR